MKNLFVQKNILGIVLFSFLIFINVPSFSQEVEKKLDSLINKIFVDMNNLDYDAILEMTHPKVFETASKEQMKALLKSTFEGNEDYLMEVSKTIPNYNLSKLFKGSVNNLEYAFFSYDMDMKMTFHKEEFDEEKQKEMLALMKSQGMNVTFLSNSSIRILMPDRVTVLLKEKETNDKWVMANYETNSPVVYGILPAEVIA